MKKHVMAAVLTAATLSMPCAFAQDTPPDHMGPHDGPHHGPHHPAPPMLRGVTLTDAQKAKLHDLMEANRPDKNGHHGPMARRELETMLLAPTLDEKAIGEAEDKVIAEDSEHLHHMVDMQEKIRTILTPEQLAQARSHMNDHNPEHGSGSDHEPPPPPPAPEGPAD